MTFEQVDRLLGGPRRLVRFGGESIEGCLGGVDVAGLAHHTIAVSPLHSLRRSSSPDGSSISTTA